MLRVDLRQLLLDQNIKITELAAEIGVSYYTMLRMVNHSGDSINRHATARALQVLGVEPQEPFFTQYIPWEDMYDHDQKRKRKYYTRKPRLR